MLSQLVVAISNSSPEKKLFSVRLLEMLATVFQNSRPVVVLVPNPTMAGLMMPPRNSSVPPVVAKVTEPPSTSSAPLPPAEVVTVR